MSETMKDFQTLLDTIATGVYGKDIRGAIHQALEWLKENGGSSMTVDKTLTKADWAADAKAVGDAVKKLETNIEASAAQIALFQALGLTLQDGKICVKVEKE